LHCLLSSRNGRGKWPGLQCPAYSEKSVCLCVFSLLVHILHLLFVRGCFQRGVGERVKPFRHQRDTHPAGFSGDGTALHLAWLAFHCTGDMECDPIRIMGCQFFSSTLVFRLAGSAWCCHWLGSRGGGIPRPNDVMRRFCLVAFLSFSSVWLGLARRDGVGVHQNSWLDQKRLGMGMGVQDRVRGCLVGYYWGVQKKYM